MTVGVGEPYPPPPDSQMHIFTRSPTHRFPTSQPRHIPAEQRCDEPQTSPDLKIIRTSLKYIPAQLTIDASQGGGQEAMREAASENMHPR